MMNNILVLPMVIPILVGTFLIFLRSFVHLQRWISFGAMVGIAVISTYILNRIQTEGILRT